VVKHVDAAELRIVVAAVLAIAADAVLVAQHLLKLGAHLARRSSLDAGSTREKKSGEEQRNVKAPSGSRHGKQNIPLARARVHPDRVFMRFYH